MSLDKNEARPLTSREIAKIVSAILGGFVSWCGSEVVISALGHFVDYYDDYVSEFRFAEYIAEAQRAMLRDNNPSPGKE